MCLQSSTFPDAWKKANVIPLPKGKSCTDFRPISILPFLSKVLERVIRDRLLLPVLRGKFDPRQFGFIPNTFGGCTNALVAIRLTILQHLAASSENFCQVLAVDFRKAFDSLSHRILIKVSAPFSVIIHFPCILSRVFYLTVFNEYL